MENTNLKTQKMRYQKNSLSYNLGLLGLACSIFAAFICLNSIRPQMVVIVKILMNILIFLVGFLAMEKAKTYQEKYGYTLVVLGGISFLRIFWYPIQLIRYTSIKLGILDGTYSGSVTTEDCSKYLNELTEPKLDAAGNIAYSSRGFLPNSGEFRGWMAIILLAIACAAFVAAGIVCIKKSKTLKNYLISINEKL